MPRRTITLEEALEELERACLQAEGMADPDPEMVKEQVRRTLPCVDEAIKRINAKWDKQENPATAPEPGVSLEG